ncbi:hypothetical protein P153DRAFT_89302 [Dothidotthia symphoricarpi CBS 119687]|uniref:Uncharacterized protein n=1 Tax=Dothidotthia symphoricarpi CBS 119687 TaxID=1392245 RepID=A0A6A6A400_9PLEO|nr:uncharacterized protein P153DRAFT_89302 [Dothidotthia symphoricarpi CBS 119687]KAF2126276.1 hypothetical protein P153DRAFT_89302 [Dothidotthia symphoricarpi CBS 119687]
MNVNKNRAITGVWKDYTTGDIILSVSDSWGYAMIAIATVWLSWSVKYLKKILGNFALFIHLRQKEPSQRSNNDSSLSERSSLLGHGSRVTTTADPQALARVIKRTSGVRDLFSESVSNEDLTRGERLRLIVLTAVVALCASGMIVGGYYASTIRLTEPARLASNRCGLWIFDGQSRSEAATRAGLLDLQREERAAEYAKDCYGPVSGINAVRCNLFYRSKLPFRAANYTNDCPFQNDICRQNLTVTFTTPTIDASDLGINSPTTHKFRRSTKCTPLSMEYPFVQNVTENGTTTYYYYYGGKPGDDPPVNYTYKTVGDPWDRLTPVYDLYAYNSASEPLLWQPRSELTIPKYSTLTIVFVSSLRILYEKRSDDAIFPADTPVWIPEDPKPWFRNSDPRARPLACINLIEVCSADEMVCWSIRAPDDITKFEWTPELTLLYTSLHRTDIFDSIKKRQGRGLLAQKGVSKYFSDALGEYHWVDEMENLVAIAHARTQINAWSVASGEDSVHEGKDGYYQITENYGNLCGKFKYSPEGYSGLNFVAFIIICLSLPVLCVVSLDWIPIETKVARGTESIRNIFTNITSHTRASRAASGQISQPVGASQSQSSLNSQNTSGLGATDQSLTAVAATITPTAGTSTTAALPQTQMQPQNLQSQTAHDEEIEDRGVMKSDEIKWEPLVLHKLLLLPWLVLWKFPRFVVSRCSNTE